MKKLLLILIVMILASCSHETKKSTSITISTTSKGIVKNASLKFPMYLTSNNDDMGPNDKVIKIHQGHFFKNKNTKDENVQILKNLELNNFSLINLSLEDIVIAEKQEIDFTAFPKLIFLNSSITDLSKDDLYLNQNIVSYYNLDDAVFIGLSDRTIDKKLDSSRFLVNDYVFSILKMKKVTKDKFSKSYIIIHDLGDSINEVMDRLPPSYVNSLAN